MVIFGTSAHMLDLNRKELEKSYYSKAIIILLLIQVVVIGIVIYQVNTINAKIIRTNRLLFQVSNNLEQNKSYSVDIYTNDIIIGKKDAPLSVIMFTSYNCIHCSDFFKNKFPKLQEEYINTGKIKFVIKFIGQPDRQISFLKAKYALCANIKGMFLTYNDLILKSQDIPDSLKLLDYIDKTIKIDQLQDCFNNPEIEKTIIKNNEYKKQNLKGTPAFIINSKIHYGDRSLEKFREIFDNELSTENCNETN